MLQGAIISKKSDSFQEIIQKVTVVLSFIQLRFYLNKNTAVFLSTYCLESVSIRRFMDNLYSF